jgi:hypothetical protein
MYVLKNKKLIKALIQREIFKKDGRRTASVGDHSPRFADQIKGGSTVIVSVIQK